MLRSYCGDDVPCVQWKRFCDCAAGLSGDACDCGDGDFETDCAEACDEGNDNDGDGYDVVHRAWVRLCAGEQHIGLCQLR